MSRRSTISNLIAQQLAAANSEKQPQAAPHALDQSEAMSPLETKFVQAGRHQSPDELPASSAQEFKVTGPRASAGPVRAMGLTLNRLEEERRNLEQALAEGARVVELAPDMLVSSFAADRFSFEAEGLAALQDSIAINGQEVPILVRPLPDGKYQIAYGHRRVRACAALGRKVRAVIRSMSDDELIIAQGLENAARVDLSFIERASFALKLELRGTPRSTIMTALATDKTELSKLISTAKAIPQALVNAIGAAPNTGRRRWMLLAEVLAAKGEAGLARALAKLLPAGQGAEPDSDARFNLALSAAAAELSDKSRPEMLLRGSGKAFAQITRSKGSTLIKLDQKTTAGFDEYLISRLSTLLDEFETAKHQSAFPIS